MQKKKLIVTGIIVLLLLLSWGAFSKYKKGNLALKGSKPMDSGIVQKDVFTSIKDALSKKMTLVCDFKDETGTSTKSYIKNGAVRVSSSGEAGQASEIIIKDKKMYMWDINTKQGFAYDIPDVESKGEVGTSDNEINQSENYLNMIDKYKDSCKVSTVEDSYFSPPTDIVFQEFKLPN